MAGHTQRMSDQRPPKKTTDLTPRGRRNVGPPKLSWLDGMKDSKAIGIKIWETNAMANTVWVSFGENPGPQRDLRR